MKSSMQKFLAVLALTTTGVANASQQANLICENDKVSMKVSYNSGPRGENMVFIELEDGTDFTFSTRFSIKQFNTRCGIDTIQSADLYSKTSQTVAEGNVHIYDKGSSSCGIGFTQASVDLQIGDGTSKKIIKEEFSCEY